MSKNKPPMHRRKDLFSLVWPQNIACTSLVNGVPKDVTVDLEEGTWSFDGEAFRIGNSNHFHSPFPGVPIGVYDRTHFKHLEAFKEDVEWAQNPR